MVETAFLLALAVLLAAAFLAFGWGRGVALRAARKQGQTIALPNYFGWYATVLMLACALPVLIAGGLLLDRLAIQQVTIPTGLTTQEIKDAAWFLVHQPANSLTVTLREAGQGLLTARQHAWNGIFLTTTAAAALGLAFAWLRLRHALPVRRRVDGFGRLLLAGAAFASILITLAIVGSVLIEALRFFKLVNPLDFLFGLQWSPQNAGATGNENAFGIVPLLLGTLLIMLIAMLVATPLGLFSAIYMAEYAGPRLRNIAKPALEILAGIPTVVYGYFAITLLSPALRAAGAHLGIAVSAESALAAGLAMGIMIIPYISSLSDDILLAVPQSLRDASYGLGATKSETIKQVVIPAALPGIMGSILLAVSRAIGETMIVVMAAGLSANLTLNPLQSVTTVTAQIVALLTGDQEFDSAKTLAAFALGLTLFVLTLLLNIVALIIVKRYREDYD